ncbi:hypothetical protein ACFVOO_24005 [Streptomyces rochei]|uniref:hypothetical protein n=1 Tax=Streptomyces rochei TaxID=1928 RepID=UPI00367A8558
MTDQTTDRHTCHNQKTATGPAWKCPRCSLPPADQTAPLADRLAHPEAVREQVRRALDFTYAVSLGYESSDQLLATYDASRAPADQTTPLRERYATAIHDAMEPDLSLVDQEPAYQALIARAAEAAMALADAGRTAAPVCICGHPEERHFEDVCQTCGCGDYLEPRDAAEVIARWREAALKARTELSSERDVSRRLLAQRQEMAKERYVWQQRGDRVEAELRRMADETATTETQAGAPGRRQTVEYFVQSQQPDGTWESASSFSTDLDFAAARLAARREKMPDLTLRLAERTTTVAVRALPDCLSCRHWSCDGTGECGALLDAWQRCDCTGPAAGARQDGASS